MKIGITHRYSIVLDATSEEVTALSDALAFDVPNSYWMGANKRYGWDGKKRYYNRLTKKLPTGLLPYALDILKASDIKPNLLDLRPVASKPKIPMSVSRWATLLKSRDFPVDVVLCNFQHETVVKARTRTLEGYPDIPWTRGLISLSVGSGKTLLAFWLARLFKGNVLYLDNSRDRLIQTYSSYEQLYKGKQPGLIMAQQWDIKRVTLGMVQTLAPRVQRKDPQVLSFLKSVAVVIVDEAHLVGNNGYLDVLEACENAGARFAMGGSLFRRKDLGNWTMLGQFGPVIKHTSSKQLRKLGANAQVKAFILDVNQPKCALKYTAAEHLVITTNEYRNMLGIEVGLRAVAAGWITLALVKRIEHGNLLKGLFSSLGYNVPFLCHKDPAENRYEYLQQMRSGATKLVIASKIFGTGINVPDIRCIIRYDAGASAIESVQFPGRGSRKKTEYNWLYLIDFNDRTSKYFQKHTRQRIRVYKDEGYAIEAVNDSCDITFKDLNNDTEH